MLGDEALKLVRELKRHADGLSSYNSEAVANTQREIRHLFSEYKDIIARSGEDAGTDENTQLNAVDFATVNVGIAAIQRNIRCLLSYNHHRVMKLCQIVMNNRADGAGKKPPPKQIRDKLSANEHQFYSEYCKLLHRYKISFDDLFDITGNMVPPQSVYVLVRALKELDFETEDGRRIILKMGHSDFLKRSDVEKYIEQGYLMHIE